MEKFDHAIEIFLLQGEIYFGDRDTRIRTVLGSCVAITMWHPHLLIGGMCHYMLPRRGRTTNEPLNGKYADEALELMLAEIGRNGTRANEYQIKLFGGGNMFLANNQGPGQHIGQKNADAGIALLDRHGLKAHTEDLGKLGHRNLIFDISNGDVWMKHQTQAYSPCDNCELGDACLPT
jgi:chemotaxis protein CheD